MLYTVSITSQGQISLPAQIRRDLGLSKTRKAFVSVRDGVVIVEPVQDMLSLKGSLKSPQKVPIQRIRKAFEKHLSQGEKPTLK